MKKIFTFIILAILVISCETARYAEYTHIADFRRHIDAGFYIYPLGTEVKKEYMALADIDLLFVVGNKSNLTSQEGVIAFTSPLGNTRYAPTGEYMLDRVVAQAKSVGADAIINYQVTPNSINGAVASYRASAIAVKLSK